MPRPVQTPPETAHTLLQGDRLSRDFTAVGVEDTAAQALEKLRAHPGTRGDLLASAPLVLAVSDNVTLLAYFGLVTRLLLSR